MANAEDHDRRSARNTERCEGAPAGVERRHGPCETWGVGPTPEDDFEPLFRPDLMRERRASGGAPPRPRRGDGGD
jgi:hypothetical protein